MKRAAEFFSRTALVWVLLFYSALTVVMTWPLALHMRDGVVGRIGDNIYFVWMIGWVERALFELGANPFDVWFLNYPEGWSLAYTEIAPAQILLALPFSLLGGATFGYNAALFLTFILSAFGMFLWVRRLTGRLDAALLAGMVFGFLPYRFAHFLIGHLNLSGTQWFPFYFMGFFDLLDARRQGWKPALLAGLALGLIGLTSQYYLYMTLLVSAFLLVCYLAFLERPQLKDPAFWKRMLAMGLVSLPLLLPAVAPYFQLLGAGGLPDRNLSVVRTYSASPTDFFLPSTDHFLWGEWVWRHFNRDLWVEATLYIGAVALALAVLAWIRRRSLGKEKLLKLLFWGGLLALVLAMGIDLRWNAEPVTLPAPSFLQERLGRDELPIPMPGFLLFYILPFYAKLRALMRFGIFLLVFSSAAAGLGAGWLLERAGRRWRLAAAALLLGLVFLDFYPGPYTQFARVEARPVDHWLAQQPGQGAVAQFPFSQAEDQEQTYYTLTHNKPYIGGFFNAFPPAQYTRISPVLERFPDPESVAVLDELGVQYVLADVDEYPDPLALRRSCEELGLHYLGGFEDQMVFELKK